MHWVILAVVLIALILVIGSAPMLSSELSQQEERERERLRSLGRDDHDE